MSVDLSFGSREAASKGAWLHLAHPVTGEPLGEKDQPVRWLIAGLDSDQYAKYSASQQEKRLQDSYRTRGKSALDVDRQVAEGFNLLAACVLAIENTVFKGEEVVFSFDTVRDVIRKEPWIGEQIQGFLADRSNFLNRSATSS